MPRAIVRCSMALLVFSLAACAEPPSKEMNQAQGAIDAARAAGAEQYAAAEFAGAVDALKKSEEAVTQRDYRLALNYAIDSRERAQTAAKSAGTARAQARGDAERLVAEVNALLLQTRARLSDQAAAKLPKRLVQEQREVTAAVDKRLQEARAAIAADNYPAAVAAANSLTAQLQASLKAIEESGGPSAPRRRR
jgi:hypothetical protein